jgi:hypothetical protein
VTLKARDLRRLEADQGALHPRQDGLEAVCSRRRSKLREAAEKAHYLLDFFGAMLIIRSGARKSSLRPCLPISSGYSANR